LEYPENEYSNEVIIYNWWPQKDTMGWIEYEFEIECSVIGAKIYWLSDATNAGGVDYPDS